MYLTQSFQIISILYDNNSLAETWTPFGDIISSHKYIHQISIDWNSFHTRSAKP